MLLKVAEMNRNYWLLKSEPEVFSIQDLAACKDKTTAWDHVRNYQARNYLRDQIKPGDLAFFYHSNAAPSGIAGIVKISRKGYPEPSQFDETSEYCDAASTRENPRWYCVDVKLEKIFPSVIALDAIKKEKRLSNMVLIKSGRLSVQPVTAQEWETILKMIG